MMKKILFVAALFVGALAVACGGPGDDLKDILAIGTKAPMTDVKMTNIDGTEMSLEDVKKENGLLVIFSCNTCPFVVGNGKKSEGWQGRYPEIGRIAEENNIGVVLVNSNEAKRDKGDSMDDMKKQHAEQNYNMPYVLDRNHVLADAFGARTTPHVYFFDSNMELIYKGAIDDNVSSEAGVEEHYLKDAIESYMNDQPIDPNSTRQIGCSIKRVG